MVSAMWEFHDKNVKLKFVLGEHVLIILDSPNKIYQDSVSHIFTYVPVLAPPRIGLHFKYFWFIFLTTRAPVNYNEQLKHLVQLHSINFYLILYFYAEYSSSTLAVVILHIEIKIGPVQHAFNQREATTK